MNRDAILQELHTLLNAHDAAIEGLRRANADMGRAIEAHDHAAVAALDANRAAIRILRTMQEAQ